MRVRPGTRTPSLTLGSVRFNSSNSATSSSATCARGGTNTASNEHLTHTDKLHLFVRRPTATLDGLTHFHGEMAQALVAAFVRAESTAASHKTENIRWKESATDAGRRGR
jgi:hypothetical protein